MLGQELDASGSPPPIRSRMSSLRSRTISRLAARSSGRHRPDRLGHPRHELVEDLALEPLDQGIEALARVRLEEVVVLEAADPLADVGRQAVELVEPAGGDVAEHRGASIGGRLPGGLPRDSATGSGGLVEPALDAGPFVADDLLELAPDVAQDVVELVALEHRLAPALEALHQVLEAGHVAARRVARPPAAVHQPPQGLGEVALGHDVVGERVEDLVRGEVGDLLAAVPRRIASTRREDVGR